MIATSIARDARTISEELWSVFAKGPAPSDKEGYAKNPSKKLFSNPCWELANYLENNFAKFTGLIESLTKNIKLWQAYSDNPKP